ncbi:MAG: alpha/beta fold hydrolase [Chloroflexi bacterium]|nr:alpha/beta fold hydrolase [Chloroflexota bacterium]
MKRLPALAGLPSSASLPLSQGRTRRLPWHIAWRAAACLVLASLACGGVGSYVAWQLTHPARKAIDQQPAVPYRDVEFNSVQDHLKLSGWFLDAHSSQTVILVHGYRANRLQIDVPALDVAQRLVAEGYNTLMFDLRDSGRSEGNETTIGVFEQRDVEGAIDYVKSLGDPGRRLILLGYSMGAATALIVAGQDPRVDAVITDSPFADLYPYLQGNLPVWSHLPAFPFTPLILAIEPALTGADPHKSDPIDWVGRTRAPILFIHGLADKSIPYQNSQQLRSAAINPSDMLWLVPGADHVKSYKTDPQGYWDRVLPFLAVVAR